MRELRAQIERVVGPVRASRRRKDRMRRELLAHLKASYDEELAKGRGGATATRHALERFGPPDVLRAGLQASVPPLERTLYARVPFSDHIWTLSRYLRRGEDESAVHHAARTAFGLGLAVLALDALIVAPLVAFDVLTERPTLSAGQCAAFIAAFQGVPAVCCFLYILCLHGLRSALAVPRSVARRAVRAGGWYVLAGAATLGGGVAILSLVGDFLNGGPASPFWPFVVAIALTPIVLTWIGTVCIAERRRREEWECLVRPE